MHRSLPHTFFWNIVICVGIVLLVLVVASFHRASAGSGDAVTGFAWSTPALGWISMTSDNCGGASPPAGCAGPSSVPYAVTADASGKLSGKAWSPNIGWISFYSADVNVPGCPDAPSSCDAHIEQTVGPDQGVLKGWAKVTAWDEWIHLSGMTAPTDGSQPVAYGVKAGAPDASGNCVWGGTAWSQGPVGWITFDSVKGTGNACGLPPPVVDTNKCPLDSRDPTHTNHLCLHIEPDHVTLVIRSPGRDTKQLKAIYTDPTTGVSKDVTALSATTWRLADSSYAPYISVSNEDGTKGLIKAVSSTSLVSIQASYSTAGATSNADATIQVNNSDVRYCNDHPGDPFCSIPD